MSSSVIVCARVGCEEVIAKKKTHNQKYCSNECCRIETNRKIMEKYYERRARRQGRERICKSCSETRLSRYNDSSVCASCQSKKRQSIDEQIKGIILDLV